MNAAVALPTQVRSAELFDEIPSTWTPLRLNELVTLISEPSAGLQRPIALENIEGWTGRFIETGTSFAGAGTAFRKGDVLFGKLRPYLAKAWVADSEGTAVGDVHVFRPRRIQPELLGYWLRAPEFIERVTAAVFGAKMPRVDWAIRPHVRLAIPPLEKQGAIVEYLDEETRRIDALIAKQEHLIEALDERWCSLLSAVFDSGDRGTATRLKRHASIQTGLTLNAGEVTVGILMPYLRVANVQVGRVDITELTEVVVPTDNWQRYALRDGDVLMTEGGDADKLGRGSLWTAPVSPCLHQNHVFALRCNHTLFNRWLVYYLEAPPARRYFEQTAKQSTNLASTNSTTVGNLPLDLPDRLEQERIVAELDEEAERTRRITGAATRCVSVLRERRQALISAAVTGKIDVRGH